MPNIYLRMPAVRCQFFRHRDPKHTLAPDEPLVFNAYMPEYRIMWSYLSNSESLRNTINMQCFSHQQWHNMMTGKSPLDGKPVFHRNSAEYLTFEEVQRLNGIRDYNKSDSVDYLCVKLPSEIEFVDVVKQVTPSWNLLPRGVIELMICLNNDFKRCVVEWALATFDFCTSNNTVLCRKHASMLERFLMRYGMDPSQSEKDNLRRIIERWFAADNNNFKSYSCADMQFVDSKEKAFSFERIKWK